MARSIKLRESPIEMAARFERDYAMDARMAKQIVSTSLELAALFEELVTKTDVPAAVTWTTGPITANWKQFDTSKKGELVGIVCDFHAGKMTDTECAIRIKALMTGRSAEETEKASGDLDAIISKLLDENPQVVEDYRKNEKAANRIIGTAMKQTGGAYSSADIVSATKKLIESRL